MITNDNFHDTLVFVGGLTPNINEQDLEKQFSVYGRITGGEYLQKEKIT
jgi:RNA recognition motif-containing protein